MIFSQRYHRTLADARLVVELPADARRKLWSRLAKHDAAVGVQRDPNDRWIDNSSVLAEVEGELLIEHGWERVPGAPRQDRGGHAPGLRHLVLECDAPFVLDALEMTFGWLRQAGAGEQEVFRTGINGVLELHGCPWRLSDGEFFKLDADFMGARLAATAHESLAANRFAGAAHEYAKARQHLGSGETMDAVFYAGKSFESVLKVLTGLEHANADRLIKELLAQGYVDDLPDGARASFGEQVLKTLPSLRNRLGGHGQGATIVEIPQAYGELAVQLAAAFHNFLVAKHLQRQPPEPSRQETVDELDGIPF